MSMIGTRVLRKEDPDLMTVGGIYVEDIAAEIVSLRSAAIEGTDIALHPGQRRRVPDARRHSVLGTIDGRRGLQAPIPL